MQALSARAIALLEQMEPNRGYDAKDLRAFVPDVSMEGLQDLMRELWVHRYVERFGYSGWRRERSTSPVAQDSNPRRDDNRRVPGSRREGVPGETKGVRPEDLFDHGSFDGMFI
jgi:hypothetical protein